MIRIILPLAMAVVAFFGPWSGDMTGADFANNTVDCLLEAKLPLSADCQPEGSLNDKLIGYSVVGGAAAAVLSVLGLLPFIGRLTSLGVLGAGGVGIGASAMTALGMMGEQGLGAVGWGAWATLGVGLVTVFAAINGIRGEGQD